MTSRSPSPSALRNAQDQALLVLARRQGLLHELPAGPPAAAAPLGEEDDGPLAHRLIREGLLPHGAVAALLRELAQGSFACAGCAERFPYFFLAQLAALDCPACGGALEHLPNPRPRPVAARLPSGAAPRPGSPRRLGPFLLLAELGRGATGVVHHARHPALGEVALKLLHPGLNDPEGLERFRREARIAHALRHPGIVRVLGAGALDGRFYCALELVRGETLRARIDRMGPAPAREAARLVRALCEAVGFAHRAGVVHRDLKPANVLLADPGALPRVTDFGLARDPSRQERLTRTGALLGTPAYMAPEQLLGEEVREAADVYALGAILYELLTGAPPFEAPTVWVLADRIAREQPVAPSARRPGLTTAFDAVCLRALAKAPSARFASCEALAAALSEALIEASR